ncbi:hypothetical protein MVA48_23170 [Blastococcus sp. PRF04-17]|nr:hypothetical protein [Blastococcus sp. PRF04-17]UOY01784.1 hypothetical protein MVA48_23170 [Blastococcus sp. PRF04-17]
MSTSRPQRSVPTRSHTSRASARVRTAVYGTNSSASRTPAAPNVSATRAIRSYTAGDGGTDSTNAHDGTPRAAHRRAIDRATGSSARSSVPSPYADRSVRASPRSRARSPMAAASVPARSAARRLNQSTPTPRKPACAAAASTRSRGYCTVADPSGRRATVAMVAKLSMLSRPRGRPAGAPPSWQKPCVRSALPPSGHRTHEELVL